MKRKYIALVNEDDDDDNIDDYSLSSSESDTNESESESESTDETETNDESESDTSEATEASESEVSLSEIFDDTPRYSTKKRVTTKLEYQMRPVTRDDIFSNEILQYDSCIQNNQTYHWNNELLERSFKYSIHNRIIRASLDYTYPIIGLLFVSNIYNSYHIDTLSIHPKFRRQGLAKLLLATLADYIIETEHKFPQVLLEVDKHNIPALTLYVKIGFHKTNHESNTQYFMVIPSEKFTKYFNEYVNRD